MKRRFPGSRGPPRKRRMSLSRFGSTMAERRLMAHKRAMLGGELKFHDLDIDVAATTTAGAIVEDSCLTIVQGIAETARIGRKITVRRISWRYRVALKNVNQSTSAGVAIRLMLYLDKQCNGATAAVLGLLETANYQSFKNLTNTGRFRVLHDKTIVVNHKGGSYDGTGTDWAGGEEIGEYHLDCNIPVEYTSTAGVIAELTSNNLGVMVIADTATGTVDSKMRIRFTDY